MGYVRLPADPYEGGHRRRRGERWEEAETHYRAALEAAAKASNRIEQADVRRFHARMLLHRDRPGDRERARESLELAVRNYRELGMPRHAVMASAMLGEAV